MRGLILSVAAVVPLGFVRPALAQTSLQERMEEMKAKNPRSFSLCEALASRRGNRIVQMTDYEGWALVVSSTAAWVDSTEPIDAGGQERASRYVFES
jgi:hypothetical protein